MTAQAGEMLVEQIVPRLRTLVPKSVKPVGAEDTEELIQDSLVVAAQMLHRVEQSGKTVMRKFYSQHGIADELRYEPTCFSTFYEFSAGARSFCDSRSCACVNPSQQDSDVCIAPLRSSVADCNCNG